MKEILESFMESSRERIKNPIIGSFMTAFLIYNWKAIIFLIFSKTSIEQRITTIRDNYSNWDSIVLPILIALGYLILLPYISSILDNTLFKIFTTRANHKNKIKLVSLNNKKETARLERQIADIKAGTKDIEELLQKNSELEKLNEDAQNKAEKLQKDNSTLLSNATSDENQMKVINDILDDFRNMENPSQDYIQKVSKKLGRNGLKEFRDFCKSKIFKQTGGMAIETMIVPTSKSEIDKFKRESLIYIHDDVSVPLIYSLTPLGFAVYLESNNASL